MKLSSYLLGTICFGLFLVIVTACQVGQRTNSDDNRLKVVATTTIVGDVVKQLGGDRIELSILLPTGTDPHGFQPAPRDLANISEADLIFANGAGLEEFLQPLIENSGGKAPIISVSDGIDLLEPGEIHQADESTAKTGEHSNGDPHTWFDPNNVKIWVQNIEKALVEADPAGRLVFTENAQSYTQQLEELDSWIQSQVEKLTPEQRLLVTDHTSFTYFADRYGFEQVGAVIPAYSTLAAPSAQELASLEDAIRRLAVKAVFVGEAVNSSLVEQLAQDTGVRLVHLYNGSLSEPDGPAATYIDFMRYDVQAIVEALK